MSAQIKEALAALNQVVTTHVESTRHVATARSFLEGAQQESDDRAAVEAWLDADDDRFQSNGRQYMAGYYLTLYPNQMREGRHPFYGATRAEALKVAAIWCRKELINGSSCHQCGDSLAKCKESKCCSGCNHSLRSKRAEIAK